MKRFLIIAGILVFQSVFAQQYQKAPCPTTSWARSTLQLQGMNPLSIDTLVQKIEENRYYRDIHSLLIVKNGYQVYEKYFMGFSAEQNHTLQPVSKSFTSALIGILLEKGFIKSIDTHILDYFKDYKNIQNLDDRKCAVSSKDFPGISFHLSNTDNIRTFLSTVNTPHCFISLKMIIFQLTFP